jgi:hypothetical protein
MSIHNTRDAYMYLTSNKAVRVRVSSQPSRPSPSLCLLAGHRNGVCDLASRNAAIRTNNVRPPLNHSSASHQY